jgi:hypothetical protein
MDKVAGMGLEGMVSGTGMEDRVWGMESDTGVGRAWAWGKAYSAIGFGCFSYVNFGVEVQNRCGLMNCGHVWSGRGGCRAVPQ